MDRPSRDSQQVQSPISFPPLAGLAYVGGTVAAANGGPVTADSGGNSLTGGSANASASDYLPGTSSGSNSPPLQSLKREVSMVDKREEELAEGETLKKRPRKSGNQYRRNIKDVFTEEKLQSVTKEAKVSFLCLSQSVASYAYIARLIRHSDQ